MNLLKPFKLNWNYFRAVKAIRVDASCPEDNDSDIGTGFCDTIIRDEVKIYQKLERYILDTPEQVAFTGFIIHETKPVIKGYYLSLEPIQDCNYKEFTIEEFNKVVKEGPYTQEDIRDIALMKYDKDLTEAIERLKLVHYVNNLSELSNNDTTGLRNVTRRYLMLGNILIKYNPETLLWIVTEPYIKADYYRLTLTKKNKRYLKFALPYGNNNNNNNNNRFQPLQQTQWCGLTVDEAVTEYIRSTKIELVVED